MKPPPDPERFARPELQDVYEQGYHRSTSTTPSLLDRFGWLPDEALL